MPSIQSKFLNVILYLIRMKKTVNRMQERVEKGERTYSEPPPILYKKHLVTTQLENGHKVWTISPKQIPGNKHIIYLHGGAYVNSFSPQHWTFMSKLVERLNCTVTAPNYPHAPEYSASDTNQMVFDVFRKLATVAGAANITMMGDSSGGGISLALAQRLRDEQLEQLDISSCFLHGLMSLFRTPKSKNLTRSIHSLVLRVYSGVDVPMPEISIH